VAASYLRLAEAAPPAPACGLLSLSAEDRGFLWR